MLSLSLTRSRVMVAGQLAAITLGMVGCSGESGAALRPSVSAPSRVVPPVLGLSRVAPSSEPRGLKAAALSRSSPVRLQIAAIGVDTGLMELGLRSDRSMEVPPGGFPAGWYTGAPTPGELGPAIIAGHIDMNGPGVFYKLHLMKPGNLVTVTRADRSKAVFRVAEVGQFPKAHFPTDLVYGNIDHAGLRLITCGGTFNSQSGHYEDNIVVFADLVSSSL
jgi:hypothetical protein